MRIVQHKLLFHHKFQSCSGLSGTKKITEVLFRVVFTIWHAPPSPLTFRGFSPTIREKKAQNLKENLNAVLLEYECIQGVIPKYYEILVPASIFDF